MHAVAATAGIDAVGEAFIGAALGKDGWPALSEELRLMFTDNGPAILAEIGSEWWPQFDAAALATIEHPTLLVSGSASLPHFREAPDALADVLPNARTARVDGNHLIDPAARDVLAFIRQVSSNR